jgi:hypothetical protein
MNIILQNLYITKDILKFIHEKDPNVDNLNIYIMKGDTTIITTILNKVCRKFYGDTFLKKNMVFKTCNR